MKDFFKQTKKAINEKFNFILLQMQWQFFVKDKQAWLSIISSIKALDSLLSMFSRYYHA